MKSFIKNIYSCVLKIFLFPMRMFPVRKKRLVFSGLTGGEGYDYSCNPRYISEYLQQQEPQVYDIFWLVTDPARCQKYENEKLHFCRHFSIRSFYYLLTAKVIVTNGSYAPWFPFRRNQYLINTWHGGGAYKKIENDKPDANRATRKRAEFCARNISLFLSSCQMANQKLFRHAFLYKGEIMECGMPRNDKLVRGETHDAAQKVRRLCQIPAESRILLYAPTYREKSSSTVPDLERLRGMLEKNGETWYVLYRAHRYANGEGFPSGQERSRDVSRYEDMQELLCAADMLITDYSSCIWDYSFLYRPCFLYTPDLEDYLKKTGFYVDIHEWPFPICQDQQSLERAVLEYDPDQNRRNIQEHHRKMGSFECGHACEAVCERIRNICEENG